VEPFDTRTVGNFKVKQNLVVNTPCPQKLVTNYISFIPVLSPVILHIVHTSWERDSLKSGC